MMLALVSSNYLRDPAAERDWQTFELRKARASENAATVPGKLARAINRVNWTRNPGPLPKLVAEAPVFPQELNGNGRCEALAVMIGSMGKYKTQYAEFVNSLADYIIALTASFQLPELDSIPNEVSSVFEEREEPEMKSETTNASPDHPIYQNINQNVNQNLLVIDGAFVKSIADQIKERTEKGSTVSADDLVTTEKEAPRPHQSPYTISIVDDDQEFLDLIQSTCHYSPQLPLLKCRTYQDPEKLLEEMSSPSQEQSTPDLLLIDLELREKSMQGLDLIEELALKKRVTSTILALSNNFTDETLNVASSKGAVMVLPKLLTPNELLPRMRHSAKIGRNKWLYQTKNFSADETRNQRPVFLSYQSLNQRTATIITNFLEHSEIDVFFDDDIIEPGDDQAARVRAGLDTARVFLALISDSYVTSRWSMSELSNALDLQKTRNAPLKIIPILFNSPKNAEQDETIIKCLATNRELTMSPDRPMDALQKLLLSIQNHLRPLSRPAQSSI
jgi:DNA-binding response OmpR family regulator